jgi:hypothetical protein
MNAILGDWMQTKQNITPEIRQEMAALIQSGEVSMEGPTLNVLNATYAEVRRRQGIRGKKSLDSKMDETLAAKALEIRGRR